MKKQRAIVSIAALLLLVTVTGCQEAIVEGVTTGLTSGFANLVETLITESFNAL